MVAVVVRFVIGGGRFGSSGGVEVVVRMDDGVDNIGSIGGVRINFCFNKLNGVDLDDGW